MKPEGHNFSLTATSGRHAAYSVLLLVVLVGGLLVYKGNASLRILEKVRASGVLRLHTNVVPLERSSDGVNVLERCVKYFVVIGPALLFGILISSAVRAFISPRWLIRALGPGTFRAHLAAVLAGTPLMLCSCCVAPIFLSVYERSSRLGPSLTVMLASPSLNPAALVLTFVLFEPRVAVARLIIGLAAVSLVGILVDRFLETPPRFSPLTNPLEGHTSQPRLFPLFLRSCLHVAVRTVPLIVVGVFASMLIAQWLPVSTFASTGAKVTGVVVAASIAVPLALPTFFEIPLALTLITAGAPLGVAVAILFAGPAVNLPSLFTIARSTNWKVAGGVASAIWLLAVTGGLLLL